MTGHAPSKMTGNSASAAILSHALVRGHVASAAAQHLLSAYLTDTTGQGSNHLCAVGLKMTPTSLPAPNSSPVLTWLNLKSSWKHHKWYSVEFAAHTPLQAT